MRRTCAGHSSRPSSGATVWRTACRCRAAPARPAAACPGAWSGSRSPRRAPGADVACGWSQPHRQRDQRAPRVAQHDRFRHAQARQRRMDQVGLRLRAPAPPVGAVAPAVAGPVEDDRRDSARPPGRREAAELELVGHRAVAVQQHQRLRRVVAAVHGEVQAHAVDGDEAAFRREVAFGAARLALDGDGAGREHGGRADGRSEPARVRRAVMRGDRMPGLGKRRSRTRIAHGRRRARLPATTRTSCSAARS